MCQFFGVYIPTSGAVSSKVICHDYDNKAHLIYTSAPVMGDRDTSAERAILSVVNRYSVRLRTTGFVSGHPQPFKLHLFSPAVSE